MQWIMTHAPPDAISRQTPHARGWRCHAGERQESAAHLPRSGPAGRSTVRGTNACKRPAPPLRTGSVPPGKSAPPSRTTLWFPPAPPATASLAPGLPGPLAQFGLLGNFFEFPQPLPQLLVDLGFLHRRAGLAIERMIVIPHAAHRRQRSLLAFFALRDLPLAVLDLRLAGRDRRVLLLRPASRSQAPRVEAGMPCSRA